MATRKQVERILKEDAKGNDQEVSPDALEKIQRRTRKPKPTPQWMLEGKWYAEQQAIEKVDATQHELDKCLVLIENQWSGRLAKYLNGKA